ncbi:MAG: SDR family oxidoreductase [Pseudomonadota bacterium]
MPADAASPRTIVITGAGSGIGRATAEAFLAAGWNVALAGRRAEALEETAAGHAAALPVPTDIADYAQVEALFAKTAERFGRVDALFNNAGRGSPPLSIDEMPLEDWHGVLDANLTGSVYCARAAFAAMRAQSPHGGRIINNGSISAYAPRPGSTPYTVTKHAISGLTRCLALDGRPYDIACGQIDIGNAASEMTDRMVDGVPQADGSVKPEPRMDVSAVADAVLHMASLPLDANVLFMTVMATKMPFVGRG